MPAANASVLARVPLFVGLPYAELAILASRLRQHRCGRGEVIFRQDDPGTSLYVIESGVVKVLRLSTEGREVILALLGPGDFFGELALLDGKPRSADAVAREPTDLLILDRKDFLEFLERFPPAALHLLEALSQRLRRTDQLVQDAAFLDVPGRLARMLLQLSESRPQGISLTQAELAAMVGATRESINKWLRFYQQRGYVGYEAGRLIVLRPEELQRHIELGEVG